MVALDRKLPLGLVAGLAASLGLIHGYLNGTAKLGALEILMLGWAFRAG